MWRWWPHRTLSSIVAASFLISCTATTLLVSCSKHCPHFQNKFESKIMFQKWGGDWGEKSGGVVWVEWSVEWRPPSLQTTAAPPPLPSAAGQWRRRQPRVEILLFWQTEICETVTTWFNSPKCCFHFILPLCKIERIIPSVNSGAAAKYGCLAGSIVNCCPLSYTWKTPTNFTEIRYLIKTKLKHWNQTKLKTNKPNLTTPN